MSDSDNLTTAQRNIGDFAPKLVSLTDDVLFGDIWEREELSKRDRSLITVAALIAGGNTEQLKNHLARAKANGLTEIELKEVIIHLAFYAGWPRAMSAITVAKSVFADRQDRPDRPETRLRRTADGRTDHDSRRTTMTTDQNHHGGSRDYRGLVGYRGGHRPFPGRARLQAGAVGASRRSGEALAAELGDTAVAITADVTDRDSLVAAADRVRSELGGADVLVNNAGVMLLAPFSTDQRAETRQMVEVNLLGAMTATEVFLDQLRDGGGDLVNISSVAGRTARAGNAAYAATKWGLNGWSEGLRQELQPDIRVTLIEPGAVATELTDHITHPGAKQGAEQLYEQLAITAEDIAEIIAFAVTRPRRLTINEILVRPTAQPG